MRRRRLAVGLAAILILIGSALVVGGASGPAFTVHDKAYYASPDEVNFIRPGLSFKILSADISSDGTIRVRFRITDPKGLPLDLAGITTPGTVTVSFVAAYIAKGQTQHSAYTTRDFTNPTNGRIVTDPWMDAGGTFEKTADGEYTYTFKTKAPAGMDRSVTHTIGGQASRNLTEFDLGTQPDNDVFNFVPDGSPVTVVRDVVRTETCNKRCHDPLALHGGNRRKVELCVLCHQPQNQDPYGGSLSFPVMIHKIHRGGDLPSVKAGTPLTINGPNHDFSDVVFPAGVNNCEVCHDPNSGAAQASAWLKPNRTACGACHDDVNFATGEGHLDLPQVSDSLCSTCHIPQGELEYDASIRGAHLDPRFSTTLPGTVFEILKVDDGAAGKRPTVTFSIKDKKGNPILPSDMDRLSLVLSGPTTDYKLFVSEDARKATGSTDGRYVWTFQNPIAPDARGSYAVGIEGYKNIKILPGTKKEQTVRDAGMNKTFYFSVDGSKVLPRRKVVAIEKCDACHLQLEMHGRNRNDVEHCVQCHNVNQTDAAGRPASAGPPQAITFKIMIHSIHTGHDLTREFAIYGGSGTKTDFGDVHFPGDRRDCAKCHVNNSEQLPLPDGVSSVNNPRSPYNPIGAIAAACTGCHTDDSVYSHALAMTTPIGESCEVCHGKGMEFSVDRVHAR